MNRVLILRSWIVYIILISHSVIVCIMLLKRTEFFVGIILYDFLYLTLLVGCVVHRIRMHRFQYGTQYSVTHNRIQDLNVTGVRVVQIYDREQGEFSKKLNGLEYSLRIDASLAVFMRHLVCRLMQKQQVSYTNRIGPSCTAYVGRSYICGSLYLI